jgi:hypothetical protein
VLEEEAHDHKDKGSNQEGVIGFGLHDKVNGNTGTTKGKAFPRLASTKGNRDVHDICKSGKEGNHKFDQGAEKGDV